MLVAGVPLADQQSTTRHYLKLVFNLQLCRPAVIPVPRTSCTIHRPIQPIVVLCLALFRFPPAAVSAPIMMATDRPTIDWYFQPSPQRSSPPAIVTASTMTTTDGPTKNQNFCF
ncbi:hypothetical protein QTP88_024897 [Uroleucon formosanum]